MRSEHLSVRLTAAEKQALEQLAEQKDETVGQLVRRTLAALAGTPAVRPREGCRMVSRPGTPEIRREQELEWMQEHLAELESLAGEWVVIEGAGVVAHDADYLKAVTTARECGVTIPFAVRMPWGRADVVYMGL